MRVKVVQEQGKLVRQRITDGVVEDQGSSTKAEESYDNGINGKGAASSVHEGFGITTLSPTDDEFLKFIQYSDTYTHEEIVRKSVPLLDPSTLPSSITPTDIPWSYAEGDT